MTDLSKLNEDQLIAYSMIAEAAARNEVCPTDTELGRVFGMSNTKGAKLMVQLLNLGVIEKSLRKGPGRQIHIVATRHVTRRPNPIEKKSYRAPGPDTEEVEEAKTLLRRRHDRVYNLATLHPKVKKYEGMYQVGRHVVSRTKLLAMANDARKAA